MNFKLLRRARRALVRQLRYQEQKARDVRGREREVVLARTRRAGRARALLEAVRPIGPAARVLEVGSGAHGLIFFFGAARGVGADPLAAHYARLFPAWQGGVPTVAAAGEQLPFPTGSFDVVLCDNVVDHALSPAGIVRELARVLAPGGLLYFTVHIHHPIYDLASRLHAGWNALGLRYEIGPFADHTVHLTLAAAQQLFDGLPLRFLEENSTLEAARAQARRLRLRHPGDLLTRLFFKNALYEVVAVREG